MSEVEPVPETLEELMDLVEGAWAKLDALVAGLDEEQLGAAGAGGWAVKDHLAHLAAWERSLVALLEGRNRLAAMGLESADGLREDELNERLAARSRDLGPPEARSLLAGTHEEVRAALRRLGDTGLKAPYGRFQPGDADPRSEEPVIGWIEGNTYGHVAEHLPWIRALAGA